MKKLILFLVVLSSGSALPVKSQTGQMECLGASGYVRTQKDTVQVISNPPGANIEVDEEYVGDAPMIVHIDRQVWRDVYCGEHAATYTLRALPTKDGHCTQQKKISGDSPKKVLFRMSLCHTTNINLEIQ